MTNKEKEKWLKLYDVAQKIGAMNPWEYFEEKDCFSYVWKDKSKTLIFSFIGPSAQTCGIACYIGEENYIRARVRLTSKNEKREPMFMLQSALICLWDDRQDLSKESYAIIKELGLKFRGKGAWLNFERYEVGYAPVPLEECEVDLLTTAFGNLFMMLRAIYEGRLDPEFEKGKTLLRWYEPKDDLYYTHPFDIKIQTDVISRLVVTVRENDWMHQVRTMEHTDYSIEIDWSYVEFLCDDETGRATYPQLLLAVERKTGFILHKELLSPSHNRADILFNTLDHLIENYGKPKEILICDEDIKGVLEDVCKKVGIKLTVRKRLAAVNKARNELLDTF